MPSPELTKDFIKTSFGNAIEWYDFSLYAIFAVGISQAFFPNYSPFISLLMTFLTFSVGFIARPLGSIIFGYIGDKIGKHYSVNLAIWCMAIPTVAIGLLPGYHQIGLAAPLLLLLLRFVQGISVGGQFSGLIAIAVDAPPGSRNTLIGIILAISMLGSLIASVVSLVSYHLFSSFAAEGLIWRLPFILSSVLFFAYLKLNPEIKKGASHPVYRLRHIFEQQPYEFLYMMLLAAVMNSIYYILFSYSVSFMQIHLAISNSHALVTINILLVLALVCYLVYGKLADSSADRVAVARRCCLAFGGLVCLLSAQLSYHWVLGCFMAMVIVYSAISTYLTGLFAEIFQKEYRMTACSLCYSGGALIGGFSPSVAEVVTTGSASGLYLLLLSLTFALFLLLDKQVPIIAQILPADKFLYEAGVYAVGAPLYNFNDLFANTKAIMPSINPTTP